MSQFKTKLKVKLFRDGYLLTVFSIVIGMHIIFWQPITNKLISENCKKVIKRVIHV